MRTTDEGGAAPRPRSKRAPKAAVAKIVLSGASTGAALGMVGVMAIAEAPPPEQPPAPQTQPVTLTPAAPPTTLPPRKVIRYVYRQVIVQDPPAGSSAPSRVIGSSLTAPPPRSPAPTPAAAPTPAPAPRRAAVTTTTTKGS